MSELNPSNPGDLASLLWEKQGRPEGHTDANWLEAEEQRLQALRHRAGENNEVELRSRGLGPIDNSRQADGSQQSRNNIRESSFVILLLLVALGAAGALFTLRKLRE